MRRRNAVVALVSLSLVASAVVAPAVVRAASILAVPGDYSTIQAAIDAAVTGDTVEVSDGTYNEDLTIAKAITVQSVNGPDTTTINGSGVAMTSVVAISAGSIHGFTIRNGGTGVANNFAPGGVAASGVAVVDGNVVTANYSCGRAAGIDVTDASTITANVVTGNFQGCTGGVPNGNGIGLWHATGATIADNTVENNGGGDGGGVEGYDAGVPTIERNVIRNNGSGILLAGDSNPIIRNNLIIGGPALSWQLACCNAGPTLMNNTIVSIWGAGIDARGINSSKTIINNVVVNNSATDGAIYCSPQPGTAVMEYNDFWNTGGPSGSGDCASVVGSNGNVSVDPKFVSAAGGDYHLRPDSPLVDKGRNSGAPPTDFEGDTRPYDGNGNGSAIVDPGFDEQTVPIFITRSTVAFTSKPVGLASGAQVVTLLNYGSAPVSVTSVGLSGANAADFSISSQTCTAGPVAGAGGSCKVTLGFTPLAIGTRTAQLDVAGPAPVDTRHVTLTGKGTDPIKITPSSIDFGPTVAGQNAAPITVTVTNSGAPVTISGATITGTNATDFSITNQTCIGSPLATNSSCTMKVGFKPKNVGTRKGKLSITGPLPVGTRVRSITGTGLAPASGITWWSTYSAGPAYTWNAGGALGRTVSGTTQYLHAAYATDRIGSQWASDNGPFVGAYYVRSTGGGSSWTTPYRVNPTNQHASMLGLATAGSRVYATWASQKSWQSYSGTDPRVLYVRVNTNHGATTSWGSVIRLSSTTGRVDYPTIAATGSDVHVAWTNSDTGFIKLSSSRDYGVHWSSATIGGTAIVTSDGYTGLPGVAVSGSTVVVVWLSDDLGTIKARVSTDRGVTWGPVETVGTGSIGFASVAARGTRIAVSWTTDDDLVVRLRIGSTWGAAKIVASLPDGDPPVPYAPAIVLQDPNRIGVAWTEQQPTVGLAALRWIESADNGGLWYAVETIQGTTTGTHTVNDWASVIWPSADFRYVLWNGWTGGTDNYRLYLRTGTGLPVGVMTAAKLVASGSVAVGMTTRPTRTISKLHSAPTRT